MENTHDISMDFLIEIHRRELNKRELETLIANLVPELDRIAMWRINKAYAEAHPPPRRLPNPMQANPGYEIIDNPTTTSRTPRHEAQYRKEDSCQSDNTQISKIPKTPNPGPTG